MPSYNTTSTASYVSSAQPSFAPRCWDCDRAMTNEEHDACFVNITGCPELDHNGHRCPSCKKESK